MASAEDRGEASQPKEVEEKGEEKKCWKNKIKALKSSEMQDVEIRKIEDIGEKTLLLRFQTACDALKLFVTFLNFSW
jgi:hypothetical protein